MKILDNVKLYLESKKYAWNEVTLKKESSKLLGIAEILNNNNPALLWEHLSNHTPYSRVNIFNMACSFFNYIEGKDNLFNKWKFDNKRLFKYYYQRKIVSISFEEARKRIESLKEPYRSKGLQLLFTGLRYEESHSINNEGFIIGKGGKPRKVFLPSFLENIAIKEIPYITMAKQLNKIGLSAHMLRKLYATKLIEKGCKEADLLKIMGWSHISTAAYYLQPKNDKEIMQLTETLC